MEGPVLEDSRRSSSGSDFPRPERIGVGTPTGFQSALKKRRNKRAISLALPKATTGELSLPD